MEYHITDSVSISDDDIDFTAARSSGPGGQNVNKVNTRVTVLLDVYRCTGLSGEEKQVVLERLATRINKEGVLRVVSQRHRTQKENRKAATARLVELLRGALKKEKKRKRTRIPAGERMRRLENKKRRGDIKRLRKKPKEM